MTILDDKWILYKHCFLQHPNDIKCTNAAGAEGQPKPSPMLLAEINVKSVIKEANGKTVRLLETNAMNEFAKFTMAVKYSKQESELETTI